MLSGLRGVVGSGQDRGLQAGQAAPTLALMAAHYLQFAWMTMCPSRAIPGQGKEVTSEIATVFRASRTKDSTRLRGCRSGAGCIAHDPRSKCQALASASPPGSSRWPTPTRLLRSSRPRPGDVGFAMSTSVDSAQTRTRNQLQTQVTVTLRRTPPTCNRPRRTGVPWHPATERKLIPTSEGTDTVCVAARCISMQTGYRSVRMGPGPFPCHRWFGTRSRTVRKTRPPRPSDPLQLPGTAAPKDCNKFTTSSPRPADPLS